MPLTDAALADFLRWVMGNGFWIIMTPLLYAWIRRPS